MHKQAVIKATIFFIYSFFLISCNPNQKKNNCDTENDLKFDSIVVNESYYLLGDTSNPNCTLEVTLIFLDDYENQKILKKINRHIINDFLGEDNTTETPREAVRNYTHNYITDYKELEKDFINEVKKEGKEKIPASWFNYYEVSSNEIIYNKCNLLSYIISIEYYTGGAHSGTSFNNHVIDLQTGNRINEGDIFVEGYQKALSSIIVDEIAQKNDLSDPAGLEDLGFFNIEEIYPNKNFYVDDEGITYTFNEYEIAAYFVGKINVTLSYNKIKHLMRQDCPLKSMLSKK